MIQTELKLENFDIDIDPIGYSSYVSKGIHRKNGEHVAIKSFPKKINGSH